MANRYPKQSEAQAKIHAICKALDKERDLTGSLIYGAFDRVSHELGVPYQTVYSTATGRSAHIRELAPPGFKFHTSRKLSGRPVRGRSVPVIDVKRAKASASPSQVELATAVEKAQAAIIEARIQLAAANADYDTALAALKAALDPDLGE